MDDERRDEVEVDPNDPLNRQDPPTAGAASATQVLAGARGYLQTLPPLERRIATMAADGVSVWEIAQTLAISDGAVADTLDRVVAAVTGREITPVETGGLGADTDPGVTGGYDFSPVDDEDFDGEPTKPIPDARP